MELPDNVILKFYMPMPKSWSNKKRDTMHGTPHQQKPDWDNLAKAVCDALKKDDQTIWKCQTSKVWTNEGAIAIEAGG